MLVSGAPDPQAPVAIFDSGIGGLTVYREIRRLLPRENFVYLADKAWAPYGERPATQVRERVLRIARWLFAQGSKALVVACNTATSAAITELRAAFPLPIIGVEPGIKPALTRSPSGRIAILATPGTLNGNKYEDLVRRLHHPGGCLLPCPCPGLAARIEAGDWDGPETRALLEHCLAPARAAAVDTLVLGCTHYPLVIPILSQMAGAELAIVDTGPAVAEQLQRRLAEAQRLNPGPGPGGGQLFSTGEARQLAELAAFAERILGQRQPARLTDLRAPP